jgi:hypothetical protein
LRFRNGGWLAFEKRHDSNSFVFDLPCGGIGCADGLEDWVYLWGEAGRSDQHFGYVAVCVSQYDDAAGALDGRAGPIRCQGDAAGTGLGIFITREVPLRGGTGTAVCERGLSVDAGIDGQHDDLPVPRRGGRLWGRGWSSAHGM